MASVVMPASLALHAVPDSQNIYQVRCHAASHPGPVGQSCWSLSLLQSQRCCPLSLWMPWVSFLCWLPCPAVMERI